MSPPLIHSPVIQLTAGAVLGMLLCAWAICLDRGLWVEAVVFWVLFGALSVAVIAAF